MCKPNIREEFSTIRDEILQLNSQAFALVGGSLTINFTIIGFGINKHGTKNIDPMLPFIGILLLVASNILIAHKIRMAHRLALFIKYYIEPSLEGIKWADVYFDYRKKFNLEHNWFVRHIAERFVDTQTSVLCIAQFVNVLILLNCSGTIGKYLLAISAAILLIFQIILLRTINNCKSMESIFKLLLDGSDSASNTE